MLRNWDALKQLYAPTRTTKLWVPIRSSIHSMLNVLCNAVVTANLVVSFMGWHHSAYAEPATTTRRTYTLSTSPPRSVDGIGTEARFGTPMGMAFDHKGNLYVADETDHVIRRITSARLVSTFAGAPGQPGHTDGIGSNARFAGPVGIAIDSHDNLYVTDHFNNTIRKITPYGEVSTFSGTDGRAGNRNGVGTQAMFEGLLDIAVDRNDNLYVTADNLIRKITPMGVVTTIAGSTDWPPTYLDATGTNARFMSAHGLAINSRGTMYIADSAAHVIRELAPNGQVTTRAGAVSYPSRLKPECKDGLGDSARFNLPTGLAIDTFGNLYVVDVDSCLVRRVSPSGMVTTLLATTNLSYSSGQVVLANGNDYVANGIAIDHVGALYVSISRRKHDGSTGSILRLSLDGIITNFAGLRVDIIDTTLPSTR